MRHPQRNSQWLHFRVNMVMVTLPPEDCVKLHKKRDDKLRGYKLCSCPVSPQCEKTLTKYKEFNLNTIEDY